MKKTMMITLFALVLALLMQIACAEPAAVVQGVFDALTAEGSDYNQIKAMYAEYFEDIQWEEAVDGDSIVINIANSEYMDGSWTFTREGDDLTAAFAEGDFSGLGMTMYVLQAVGAYYDVDRGVDPDYFIRDYNNFYDREALIKIINDLR